MGHKRAILAFDAALAGCTAAVVTEEGSWQRKGEGSQAQILVPLLQDVLKDAGIAFSDIDLIVTTIGPGSFTGLRIGLSTAKALALALGCKTSGVTTLDAILSQTIQKNKIGSVDCIVILIETKRSDFYYQIFDKDGKAVMEPAAGSAEDIRAKLTGKKFILAGDAVERFMATADFKPEGVYPCAAIDPVLLAALGRDKNMKNISAALEPLYLRGADVTKPKSEGRTTDAVVQS